MFSGCSSVLVAQAATYQYRAQEGCQHTGDTGISGKGLGRGSIWTRAWQWHCVGGVSGWLPTSSHERLPWSSCADQSRSLSSGNRSGKNGKKCGSQREPKKGDAPEQEWLTRKKERRGGSEIRQLPQELGTASPEKSLLETIGRTLQVTGTTKYHLEPSFTHLAPSIYHISLSVIPPSLRTC